MQNNNWFVLHVLTGKEAEVGNRLQAMDISSLIPTCMYIERRDQKYVEVPKTLFPGYVFLQAELAPRSYYAIKSIPAVIRFLGMQEGIPSTVPPAEMEPWLIFGNNGEPFEISEGERIDGKTRIRSGPLIPLEDKIVSVDARQGRAKLEVDLIGQKFQVSVGIKVTGSLGKTADEKSPCEEQDEQTVSEAVVPPQGAKPITV